MKKKNKKQQEEGEGEEEQKNDNNNSCTQLQTGNDARVGEVAVGLRREMSGVGGVAEGNDLMEGWSGNQLELFHALVRMVSKVGDEGAAGEFPGHVLYAYEFCGEDAIGAMLQLLTLAVYRRD
jgi:hypothetical protein